MKNNDAKGSSVMRTFIFVFALALGLFGVGAVATRRRKKFDGKLTMLLSKALVAVCAMSMASGNIYTSYGQGGW